MQDTLGKTHSRRKRGRLATIITLRPTARQLRNDRRGAAMLEFALVSLPFFGVLLASLTTSLVFFAQQNLESVAADVARGLLTGQTQKTPPSAAQFKTLACAKLPTFMKCQNLLIDVSTATTFGAANTATPTITFGSNGQPSNTFAYDVGTAQSIVVMRMMYVWDLPTVSLGYDISNIGRGKRLLMATSVARTENYS